MPTKTCKKCQVDKPLDEFWKHPQTKDGRQTRCKDCMNADQRARLKTTIPEQRHRRIIRAKAHKLGMTVEEFEAFVAARKAKPDGHLCDLCGHAEERWNTSKWRWPLVIDHCHETGKIRGWLCTNCNLSLGYFRHNPELLRKAAAWLE